MSSMCKKGRLGQLRRLTVHFMVDLRPDFLPWVRTEIVNSKQQQEPTHRKRQGSIPHQAHSCSCWLSNS